MTISVELLNASAPSAAAIQAQVEVHVARLHAAAQSVLLAGGTEEQVRQVVEAAMRSTLLMPTSVRNRDILARS